jgi:hypothetical protein
MNEKYTLTISHNEENTENSGLSAEQTAQLHTILPKVTFSPRPEIVDSIVQLSAQPECTKQPETE